MGAKKRRHIKTLYERFSHQRVDDLAGLKANINESLKSDYEEHKRAYYRGRTEDAVWDLWKALGRLNVPYGGKFYVSCDYSEKFYSDAYCFRDIWEKIVPEKPFDATEELFIEVRVLAADFKDAVLLIYKDRNTLYAPFNIHIMRDKHSDVLLEGNIAHVVSN